MSNEFCNDCGAPVLTDTFEVRNPEMPGMAVIIRAFARYAKK